MSAERQDSDDICSGATTSSGRLTSACGQDGYVVLGVEETVRCCSNNGRIVRVGCCIHRRIVTYSIRTHDTSCCSWAPVLQWSLISAYQSRGKALCLVWVIVSMIALLCMFVLYAGGQLQAFQRKFLGVPIETYCLSPG